LLLLSVLLLLFLLLLLLPPSCDSLAASVGRHIGTLQQDAPIATDKRVLALGKCVQTAVRLEICVSYLHH
jgi:hypothetical protein